MLYAVAYIRDTSRSGSITVEIPYARTVLSDGVNVTQISVSRSDEYFFLTVAVQIANRGGAVQHLSRTGEERGTEIRLTIMLPYVYMSVARAANDFLVAVTVEVGYGRFSEKVA